MPTWRASDPETSMTAALSISQSDLTETKKNILALLRAKAMTDEQLLDEYLSWAKVMDLKLISPSGLRSRRSELVDAGLIMDSGKRLPSKSGRAMIVWSLKP